jgi:hypothetical protein
MQDNVDNEPDERFKILLRNPTNAVIGDISKAVVHILNAVNGGYWPMLVMPLLYEFVN